MPSAVELIVETYVRLADREKLLDLQAHRETLLVGLAGIIGIDPRIAVEEVRREMAVIRAGLEQLDGGSRGAATVDIKPTRIVTVAAQPDDLPIAELAQQTPRQRVVAPQEVTAVKDASEVRDTTSFQEVAEPQDISLVDATTEIHERVGARDAVESEAEMFQLIGGSRGVARADNEPTGIGGSAVTILLQDGGATKIAPELLVQQAGELQELAGIKAACGAQIAEAQGATGTQDMTLVDKVVEVHERVEVVDALQVEEEALRTTKVEGAPPIAEVGERLEAGKVTTTSASVSFSGLPVLPQLEASIAKSSDEARSATDKSLSNEVSQGGENPPSIEEFWALLSTWDRQKYLARQQHVLERIRRLFS